MVDLIRSQTRAILGGLGPRYTFFSTIFSMGTIAILPSEMTNALVI